MSQTWRNVYDGRYTSHGRGCKSPCYPSPKEAQRAAAWEPDFACVMWQPLSRADGVPILYWHRPPVHRSDFVDE